jgi:hypothetical protein
MIYLISFRIAERILMGVYSPPDNIAVARVLGI